MDAKLALAFSAGMVATVNPCGFALLPAYLSYFLGLDGDDARPRPDGSPVLRAIGVSGAVTTGFLVVFVAVGVLWSSLSDVIGTRLPYFSMVVGLVLVVMGVAMLRGFMPTLRLPRVELAGNSRELGAMFLYGISYAVASLSCTIAIFIAIVSTTLTNSSFAASMATFVAYGLGMGMTLTILTIAVALARTGIMATFRRLLPHMHQISGVMLILAGTFVGYYAWVEVQELRYSQSSSVVRWTREIQNGMQVWVERNGAGRLAAAAAIVITAAVVIAFVIGRPGRSDDRTDADRTDADPAVADAELSTTDDSAVTR